MRIGGYERGGVGEGCRWGLVGGVGGWPKKKKKNLKKWSSKEWFQKCSVQVGEEWLLLRVFVSRADPEPED